MEFGSKVSLKWAKRQEEEDGVLAPVGSVIRLTGGTAEVRWPDDSRGTYWLHELEKVESTEGSCGSPECAGNHIGVDAYAQVMTASVRQNAPGLRNILEKLSESDLVKVQKLVMDVRVARFGSEWSLLPDGEP